MSRMYTRTRFLGLITLLVLLFSALLIYLNEMGRDRARLLLEGQRSDSERRLIDIIELQGERVRSYTNDYSYWDEMVDFVGNPDTLWAKEYLIPSMETFDVSALWVYSPDGQRVFSLSKPEFQRMCSDSSLDQNFRSAFAKSWFSHFSITSEGVVAEVNIAPIHRTGDLDRVGPPQGFFVTARAWDRNYISLLALHSELRLCVASISNSREVCAGDSLAHTKGVFQVERLLADDSGRPVARVIGNGVSPLYDEFQRSGTAQLVALISFSLLVILILTVTIRRWITLPLDLVARMLDKEIAPDPELLKGSGIEFQLIGNLLESAASQEEELEAEIAERIRVAEELIASEGRFRALFDNVSDLILLLGSEGDASCWRIIEANRSATETLLYNRDQLLQTSPTELVSAETLNLLQLDTLESSPGVRAVKNCAIRCSDGSDLPVEITARHFEFGGKRFVIAVIRDLSEQERAEQELESARNFTQHLISEIDALVVGTDVDGNITMFNEAASRATGCTAEEVLGKSWFEQFTPAHRYQEIIQKLVNCRTHQTSSKLEYPILTKSGEEKYIVWSNNEIVEKGVTLGMISLGIDITERKTLEDALTASEEKFRTVVEHIGTGIALISPEMEILDLNAQMRRWFPDIRPSDHPKCFRAFNLPPRETCCTYCPTALTLKDGLVHEAITNTPGASGTLHFRVVSSPIKDHQGRITAAIEMVEDMTQQFRMQRALQIAHDRTSSVIKASPLAITLLDSTGKVTLWNESATRIYGWSEAEVVGNSHPGILPHLRQQFEKVLARAFDGNETMNAETCMLKNSGETIDVRFSCGPVSNADGKVEEVVLICADVSEHNRTQQALEGTNRLLTAFMGNLPGIVYRCKNDTKRTMEFVSEGCLSLTGRSPAEFVNHEQPGYASIIHPEDLGNVQRQLELAIKHESAFSITYRIVMPSGGTKWVWEQGHAMPMWRDGETKIEGLILDVTERRSQEELRIMLATAVEQAAESIVVTSADGSIEFVNPAFESTTGYTLAEVVGRNPRVLKSGKHDERFYENMWATLQRGEVWQGRLINRCKDGRYIEEETTISPVRNPDGVIINFVALKRDVTKLIELETQLLQSQKLEAVGSLAAGIAHEINTPIQFVGDNVHFLSDVFKDLLQLAGIIRSFVSSIDDDDALKPRIAHVLDHLSSVDVEYLTKEVPVAIEQTLGGVDRVATIVRAMKSFSHPDKGEKSSVDINEALRTTLTVARNEIKYVADVETVFAENLPLLPCYPGALNQVFLNLLVNSAHAIAEVLKDSPRTKGTITVKTYQEHQHLVVSIGDTGSGISPENCRKIFDPFFTTKEVGRGTGQGLSIARSIVVDKHGGSLTFDTELGKGTTFYIKLPLAKEALVSEAHTVRR